MGATRRAFVGLSPVALGGCRSEPGRSCSGATVRQSLRPNAVNSSLRLDSGAIFPWAIVVLEMAIEDERLERCVSWDLPPDETGASPSLDELVDAIESGAGIELSDRTGPVRVDARFDGVDYRLTLSIERSG